jgi:sialate O-acetylesterase
VEGKQIRIIFTHAKGLKTTDGKPPGEFEIAGDDGKYVPATATIDGETVLVESPEVANPVKARYACKNAPVVTLVNGADLPCSAFHTDNWQGGTAE